MEKIEHIGIAVKSIDSANFVYKKLLGVDPYKEELVESEGVKTSFFKIGESKIELLEAVSDSGSIAGFIAKRGEGVHHVAFLVDDIRKEMERLRSEGFQLLMEEPKVGADNKLICFVHPKSCSGVLIELCQEIKKRA